MNRRINQISCSILAFLLLLLPMASSQALMEPSLSAKGACLMEVNTGRILYSKNGDAPMPMASTTKVMTALLAVESGKLDEVITVPKEGTNVEGSSLYLEEGEQFSLRDLTYGLMLQSGNDAAEVIARYLGGTPEEFAAMMNARAKELGAVNTIFVNPHGLPAKQHYTSANDLARITSAAMKNETFAEIVSTKYYEMTPKGSGNKRTLKNKNKLLWNYDSATGVKTGYTKEAGKCLVASSSKERLEVVSVVLACPNMWEDTVALLNYGHDNYWLTQIAQKGEVIGRIAVKDGEADEVPVVIRDNIYYPLLINDSETLTKKIDLPSSVGAPVEEGQLLGRISYQLEGKTVIQAELLAEAGVNKQSFFFKIKRFFKSIL